MALTKQDLADIRVVVVDAINESFEVLSAPRFTALEERMDRIEYRMDRIEYRMDRIEYRMESLEERVARQEKELRRFKDEVYVRFSQIDTKMEELSDKITMLDEDVRTLYKLVDAYKTTAPDKKAYARLTIDQKMQALHAELHKTATQAGIILSHK